ncbi:MAG: PAS domain S-box protein [Planctomycetaceae bacterium]|nr:PAS domain S-box protein [Planctomycetaceae bacterium]
MRDNPLNEPLSESEYRYRSLRTAVSDYFYHVEVDEGRIRRKIHGATCAVVTGYTADEYAADPLLWMAIVLEEDRASINQQIANVISGRNPAAIEYRIRRKDGKIRWMRKTVVPYHDQANTLIAYDALLRDVTQRKQIEHDLRQSEERFRLIFEDDLTGDYLAAHDGTILLCNQAFVEIFGFSSRNEAVGSHLANLFAGPPSWPDFITLLTENKSLERYERAGRHSDGTIRHVVETVVGTFDADGNLQRIKGYVFDDTTSRLAAARMQRRNAELEEVVSHRTQALREKHEHLQAIWNSAFDAIITIDSKGQIETANRATEKMFGYSVAELPGQNVNILMPSPFREEHDGYLRRFRETGEVRILNVPRELVARRKDGSTFPIDLSVTQVDHSEFYNGIIRDISERKELQTHVLEIAAEEQRRIGQELHDGIGQELTGLSLIAGTLLSLITDMHEREWDGQIVRQIDETGFNRIREIIQKLNQKLSEANRNVHQLSHGIMPVQIDAEALRSALEELAASTHTPPKVHCRFDCPQPVMAAINTTATHLYRIAQEAVNNALKHSQASEICISLRQDHNQILLEVRDNGVGIPATKSDVDVSRRTRGMGLQTMQYRAGMIGGTLHIEQSETGGTRVRCAILLQER